MQLPFNHILIVQVSIHTLAVIQLNNSGDVGVDILRTRNVAFDIGSRRNVLVLEGIIKQRRNT